MREYAHMRRSAHLCSPPRAAEPSQTGTQRSDPGPGTELSRRQLVGSGRASAHPATLGRLPPTLWGSGDPLTVSTARFVAQRRSVVGASVDRIVCAPTDFVGLKSTPRTFRSEGGPDSALRSTRPYGEEGTAETVRNRVEHGRGHGLSNGFAYPQRSRKATAGCLMPSRSVRTCGLASK